MPVREAPHRRGRVSHSQTGDRLELDRVPRRDHVAPGTPRRPDTYTVSGTLHSQLGSANRYRWLAPADSRCEDMPWTRRPFPPPTLARAHGTAHGRPAVGNASAPTDAYPSSHPASHAAGHARCSRAPHATQRALTGPSCSLPSTGLRAGTALHSCTVLYRTSEPPYPTCCATTLDDVQGVRTSLPCCAVPHLTPHILWSGPPAGCRCKACARCSAPQRESTVPPIPIRFIPFSAPSPHAFMPSCPVAFLPPPMQQGPLTRA